MSEAPERILAGDWEQGVFGDTTTNELAGSCIEKDSPVVVEGWQEHIRADLYQSQAERIAELEKALKIIEEEAGVRVERFPEGIRWFRRDI